MNMQSKATLCWRCANACGGCSWSDGSFTPVPGWNAEPTNVWIDHSPKGEPGRCRRVIGSFRVIECPEYVSDIDQYTEVDKRWI